MTRFVRSWLGVAATTATLAFGGSQAFAQKELVFGLQCDRTGPTANVGTVLCPGYQDYIALINSKGGVEGYKIKVLEIDNEYKVPPAMEAHERFKKEGAILEDLAKSEGFDMRTFAVPAPGLEMGAQILDITGRYKPDYIITHLFGRAPSVSIKELKGKGFPLSKVVAFVWGSAESDIIAAGGMGLAEGYSTMQFAGVGKDFPVIKDIEAMYKAQGKAPPKEMDSTVYYNRGIFIAALHVEAARNAIKAKGGAMPTSEDVKKGMEAIKGFTLGGFVPPMELTAADHEGGGWVQ